MKILAIDLGTKSGWARLNTEDPASITWGWNVWSHVAPEDRIIEFGRWLEEQLKEEKPDVVAFEEVPFAQGRGAWVIHRQEGVLQYLCREVAYVGVRPEEIKSHATGKGAAGKEEMVQAAVTKLRGMVHQGTNGLTHDEADAIMLAFCVAETMMD